VFAVLGGQDTKNVFFFSFFSAFNKIFFFPPSLFQFRPLCVSVLSVGETVARGDTQEMKLLAKQRAARRSMST
jgi:hypothetical protein